MRGRMVAQTRTLEQMLLLSRRIFGPRLLTVDALNRQALVIGCGEVVLALLSVSYDTKYSIRLTRRSIFHIRAVHVLIRRSSHG